MIISAGFRFFLSPGSDLSALDVMKKLVKPLKRIGGDPIYDEGRFFGSFGILGLRRGAQNAKAYPYPRKLATK